MDDFQSAVLRTLVYADIFDYPLKGNEVCQRLIGNKKISQKKIISVLGDLIKRKKITFLNGYYFLPGREKLVDKRKKREAMAKEKIILAKKGARLISKIPFVSMIGLSGSLAFSVAKPGDDIDLVVVSRPGSLWMARIFVYLLLKTTGRFFGLKLRSPACRKTKNRLCLNVFLDSSDLEIKPAKQTIFTAYQILFLKPLVDKDKIFDSLCRQNYWTNKFLPNKSTNNKSINKSGNQNYKTKKLLGVCILFLNRIAYFFQLLYMKGKPKGQIGLTKAFFHPQSKAKKTLALYKSVCSDLSIPLDKQGFEF
jgi:hypothetical protein